MAEKTSLYRHLKQLEVDFVIPLLAKDIPLCIDPFLLFKSRDPDLRALHRQMIDHFSAGMMALKAGDIGNAERILTFPEVPEVGFGYGASNKRGSGLGVVLRRLLIDTLRASPAILERGIRHIEEMQLISPGIGPDRIGDITSNVIKEYLIGYTQRQCVLHNIPLQRDLPIAHVYDNQEHSWRDGYFDLPVNPHDGAPVLLVPRRIVRHLPWINYDNFVRTEFRAYLAAKRNALHTKSVMPSKADVTSTSRVETVLIDRYVKQREQQSAEAQPYMPTVPDEVRLAGASLAERLRGTPVGHAGATSYQHLVLDILTFVFYPDLIDGRVEERTIDGTERRDIIFTNDSDSSFLTYVRYTHDALTIMFEVKNVADLSMAALNQSATYLGDRIGRLGLIVTRHRPDQNILRKQIAVFNDSKPRKVLLIISDSDLADLLELRLRDASPVTWLQKRYREFRTAVQ